MDPSILVTALIEKGGILAILLVGSLWFNWVQYKEGRLQEKERREEGKANTEKQLTAMMGSTAATAAGTEALKSMERVIQTALDALNRRP